MQKASSSLRDYREMLREKDLDLADRHAGSLACAQRDRSDQERTDLYLQKPISVDVAEGRAILDAAREQQTRRADRHATPLDAALDQRD